MRLWIDTEFNGFEGDLISIALVAENGEYYYAVRSAYEDMEIVSWVQENVVPHLFKTPDEEDVVPLTDKDIQEELSEFLYRFSDVKIVADWPEDLRHLCKLMITGPGWIIDTPETFTLEIDRRIDVESEVPHNALYDAIANREFYLEHLAS